MQFETILSILIKISKFHFLQKIVVKFPRRIDYFTRSFYGTRFVENYRIIDIIPQRNERQRHFRDCATTRLNRTGKRAQWAQRRRVGKRDHRNGYFRRLRSSRTSVKRAFEDILLAYTTSHWSNALTPSPRDV